MTQDITDCALILVVEDFSIGSAVRKSDIQRLSKFPLALGRQNQFALSNIHQLDIADGLKELLLNKNYDLNFLLHSEPSSLSAEMGIDESLVIKVQKDSSNQHILLISLTRGFLLLTMEKWKRNLSNKVHV